MVQLSGTSIKGTQEAAEVPVGLAVCLPQITGSLSTARRAVTALGFSIKAGWGELGTEWIRAGGPGLFQKGAVGQHTCARTAGP